MLREAFMAGHQRHETWEGFSERTGFNSELTRKAFMAGHERHETWEGWVRKIAA